MEEQINIFIIRFFVLLIAFFSATTFFTLTDATQDPGPKFSRKFYVSRVETNGGLVGTPFPLPPLGSITPLPSPPHNDIPAPFCIYPPFPFQSPPQIPASPPTVSPPSTGIYSPPSHGPSPPKSIPTPPPPPQVQSSPPLPQPPPHKNPRFAMWCVVKPTVQDSIIQEAVDYACGTGADCKPIQPNGPCFQPNTLFAHASYAFNSYWQNTKLGGGTCDFGGIAMLVSTDPSFDDCNFIYN